MSAAVVRRASVIAPTMPISRVTERSERFRSFRRFTFSARGSGLSARTMPLLGARCVSRRTDFEASGRRRSSRHRLHIWTGYEKGGSEMEAARDPMPDTIVFTH